MFWARARRPAGAVGGAAAAQQQAQQQQQQQQQQAQQEVLQQLELLHALRTPRIATFSAPLTLYHQTSPEAAHAILASGGCMRPGPKGTGGSGIYFAASPQATSAKANHKGVILQCTVLLGRVRRVDRPGDWGGRLRRRLLGYDSVALTFLEGGLELVVFSPSAVRDVRVHRVLQPCASGALGSCSVDGSGSFRIATAADGGASEAGSSSDGAGGASGTSSASSSDGDASEAAASSSGTASGRSSCEGTAGSCGCRRAALGSSSGLVCVHGAGASCGGSISSLCDSCDSASSAGDARASCGSGGAAGLALVGCCAFELRPGTQPQPRLQAV